MSESDSPKPKANSGIAWRTRDHTRGNLGISLMVLALPCLSSSQLSQADRTLSTSLSFASSSNSAAKSNCPRTLRSP